MQYTYNIIYMYYRDMLADKIETLQHNRHKAVYVCVCASVHSCLIYIYIYIYADVC